MKRRIFNLLAAVSMVMCVATSALRVREFFVVDEWDSKLYIPSASLRPLRGVFKEKSILAEEGWLVATHSTTLLPGSPWSPQPVDGTWVHYTAAADSQATHPPSWTRPWARKLLVTWDRSTGKPPNSSSRVRPGRIEMGVRLVPVIAVSSLLPMVWILQRFRTVRAATLGRCPKCGYDLRATPDRCPECGTAAESRSQQSTVPELPVADL